ncbi:hypothetical protein OEV98_16555 [Caldibacillus lycopersici]|uniref:Uncharacterized protein n=1 Tax=Perspicuibacillus lycopersici TaxID=1325689 RepID=A0AAE3IY98_9BACI|nr:hypothetical protein [Perspicuibacillus lycopersici]MCU9615149.1 hypothetical protein [Perspicuibacillus lycopersici]
MARNESSRDIVYLLVNTHDHNVISYGITFHEFIDGLKNPLSNLLLLKHEYEDSEFHLHTQLSYVTKDHLLKASNHDVNKFRSFCWVDFEDIFSLDTIEDKELAELLYLGHMKKHLSLPFFQNINNRFAYLTDNDGWMNKIYYRNWADFYDVLSSVISGKLSDRKIDKSIINFRKKKFYPPVDQSILHQLNSKFTEGIVISFHSIRLMKNQIEIPFWVVGDFYDMDEMMEVYHEKQVLPPAGYLSYDKKQRDWTIDFTKKLENG